MSDIIEELQAVKQAAAKQTLVAQEQTETVAGMMGKIDQRVAQKLGEMDQWRDGVKAADLQGEGRYQYNIDLTGLSTDVYYPVWWRMPATGSTETTKINICRHYSWQSNDAKFNGKTDTHVASLLLDMEGADVAWGGGANFLNIKRLIERYRHTVKKISFGMSCIVRPLTGNLPLYGSYSNGQVIGCQRRSGCYLRGGLSYKVFSNFPINLQYSRENEEVSIDSHKDSVWEINWVVKPYPIDDEFLGDDYQIIRVADTKKIENEIAER